GRSAAQLRELRGPEVVALLADLNRHQQVQLVAMAHPSAAAEALRQLDPDHREALLAELDEADRARLRAMLRSYARGRRHTLRSARRPDVVAGPPECWRCWPSWGPG